MRKVLDLQFWRTLEILLGQIDAKDLSANFDPPFLGSVAHVTCDGDEFLLGEDFLSVLLVHLIQINLGLEKTKLKS